MSNMSQYTVFKDVPDSFTIFEKDGEAAWTCNRCDETGVWSGSIESLIKFGNQFHQACNIKADLVQK
jgi:hypothetical protein